MNTFETREQTSLGPRRPQTTPWIIICTLSATVAFLAGHILWSANSEPAQKSQELTAPITANKLAAPFRSLSANPVADVVATVGPTVVSIDTTITQKDTGEISLPDILSPKSGHPLLRDPSKYEAHGSGSGVVIRSDGYILTNNHVVKDASQIKVTLTDGRSFIGRVLGKDSYSDIAVVKIPASGLKTARLGESNRVRPGDWAIAIGTPLGLSHTVTMGIVSAIGRSLADLNNNVDLIQTDAAINPGNSGGPLLNIDGDVIGINMAIRTDAQNIGFSIPIDTAKDAINAILSNRPILHPYLGISMVDYDPELASSAGLSSRVSGVLVSKVVVDGPAAKSGINAGDLIRSVENTPVKTGSDVQKIVRSHRVGTKIELQLVRAGRVENIDVVLRPFPQAQSDES